jgi:NAD(P)-dependent dehydrogenase (short-subunit alcohol dehydrogenase family)
MMGFDGRVCVVTGASSGIGRALAIALAQNGARVWAIGRNRERLDGFGEETEGLTGTVIPVVADLERDAELDSAADEILASGDYVDILIHSAGAIALGPFESVSGADFDRQYRVNLRAPVMLTQKLLAALKQAEGQIVFINSSAGLRASASNTQYAATKHGLKAIADGLRDEVNPDGVRVISVYTGRTATPMQATVHEVEGRPYRPELLLRPEDVVDVVLSALSVPPSGEVTDVNLRPIGKLPAS